MVFDLSKIQELYKKNRQKVFEKLQVIFRGTQWLLYLNKALLVMIAVLLVTCFLFLFFKEGLIPPPDLETKTSKLPKIAFNRNQEAYNKIGAPFLFLENKALSIELPNLQPSITYYGISKRPDAKFAQPTLKFSLGGEQQPVYSIASGEKLYVLYDTSLNPSSFVFSKDNEPTSLWIEATSQEDEALIKVGMVDEQGELVLNPKDFLEFRTKEKKYPRYIRGKWKLGEFQVDGTLLAKQKARWYGKDLFLARHGGGEYTEIAGKERVEFKDIKDGKEEEKTYSCFVGEGGCLAWNEEIGRWEEVELGKESLNRPLLSLKKQQERILQFELWDNEGHYQIPITLILSRENWKDKNLSNEIKFLGARTHKQFIIEIQGKRMLLHPKDWLLLTDTGWKVLQTVKELDAYVNYELMGTLFVFDGLEGAGDTQLLKGVLFSPYHSQMEVVSIPLQNQGSATKKDGVDKFLNRSGPSGYPNHPGYPPGYSSEQEAYRKMMHSDMDPRGGIEDDLSIPPISLDEFSRRLKQGFHERMQTNTP